MRNLRVMVILLVVEDFGTVLQDLGKKMEKLKTRGRIVININRGCFYADDIMKLAVTQSPVENQQ